MTTMTTTVLAVYVLLLAASVVGIATKDYKFNAAGLAASLFMLCLWLFTRHG